MLVPGHLLLASGVEKLRPNLPLEHDIAEDEEGKGRELGGAFDPAVLLPERGGDWTQAGVLPPLSGSALMRTSSNPFSELLAPPLE